MQRVCLEPGCPTLTDKPRCPAHRSQRERARGTRTARGYDNHYLRAADQAKAGATHCTNCGEPFTPTNPPTAGHVEAIRNGGTTQGGLVPQCRRCNYGWQATDL